LPEGRRLIFSVLEAMFDISSPIFLASFVVWEFAMIVSVRMRAARALPGIDRKNLAEGFGLSGPTIPPQA